MNRYTELYAWIRHTFGTDSFDIDEFRHVFPTSQAPKIMHDLVEGGYLERVKRGVYRAVEPDELIDSVIENDEGIKKTMKDAERKYAYTDSTAVTIWTSGYYWTGFTKGFRPIHIKVKEDDLDYWKHFFTEKGIKFALEGKSRTLFGHMCILHPEKDFDVEDKEGKKVIPLEEVIELCLDNRMIYQPALEYLNQIYGIDRDRKPSVKT